jgi:hypothetical protein
LEDWVEEVVDEARDRGAITFGEVRSLLNIDYDKACRVIGLLMWRGLLVPVPAVPKNSPVILALPENARGFGLMMRTRVKAGRAPVKSKEEKADDRATRKARAEAGYKRTTHKDQASKRQESLSLELYSYGPRTVTELSEARGWSKDSVKRHLDVLVGKGEVETMNYKAGGRGRPTILYALAGVDWSKYIDLPSGTPSNDQPQNSK